MVLKNLFPTCQRKEPQCTFLLELDSNQYITSKLTTHRSAVYVLENNNNNSNDNKIII